VELGTIIVSGHAAPDQAKLASRTKINHVGTNGYSVASWDLLGQSILERTVERLKSCGITLVSVVRLSGNGTGRGQFNPRDKAVLEYARQGVRRILLIEFGPYVEFDLLDLLRFHLDRQSPVTGVANEKGPLGITLLEAHHVTKNGSSFWNQFPAFFSCSSSYEFTGFVSPLSTPDDYRQLVQSALAGHCVIKPAGREVQPGIWIAPTAKLHSSVRILGPAYIGAHTRIRPGAMIGKGSSIEQQCDIECGTLIHNATVLPSTYIGPGLNVSDSIVQGSRLYHLGRKLDVQLGESGLIGWTVNHSSRRLLANLGSLLVWKDVPDLSTPSRAPASLDYLRNWFVE
jgi:hypothetical protein